MNVSELSPRDQQFKSMFLSLFALRIKPLTNYLSNALAALDGLQNQFVCVSVSQWVCQTKRVERSTDRNLSPIFTKLATKVESQELWLPIVFGGIAIVLSAKPELELNLTIAPIEKYL